MMTLHYGYAFGRWETVEGDGYDQGLVKWLNMRMLVMVDDRYQGKFLDLSAAGGPWALVINTGHRIPPHVTRNVCVPSGLTFLSPVPLLVARG